MNDLINHDLEENILKITLNNHSAQNTLSLDIINNLNKIILNADSNNEVKVIMNYNVTEIFDQRGTALLLRFFFFFFHQPKNNPPPCFK